MFGRERHRLHKEDMGGVGTFDKECRTLYVGGLALRTKLEKLLWSEFGEWGEIEVSIVVEEMNVSVHIATFSAVFLSRPIGAELNSACPL